MDSKTIILPRRQPVTIVKDSDCFQQMIKSYWLYYLELEDEFLATKKYVEFDLINYKTYSIEYLKLFQTVCSEIDVFGKEMACAVDSSFKKDEKCNILKWWYAIEDSFQTSTTNEYQETAKKPSSMLKDKAEKLLGEWELIPWENYDVEMVKSKDKNGRYRTYPRLSTSLASVKKPSWWKAYNDVKHQRTSLIKGEEDQTNFTKANLWNLSNAFAGLFILEKSYLEEIGTEEELRNIASSKLFENEDKYTTLVVG